MNNTT